MFAEPVRRNANKPQLTIFRMIYCLVSLLLKTFPAGVIQRRVSFLEKQTNGTVGGTEGQLGNTSEDWRGFV